MLHVDKVDSLQTEIVHISASGLDNFQCYKFYLKFHYFAGSYHSYCVVQSDDDGFIDLARDKPVRGTYHESDSMGLFLTLQPSQEVRFGHNAGNNKAKPFYYTLQLISNSGAVLDQVNLRKLWIHPMVTQIEVAQDGIHGIIFKPPGPGPFPCIIDVPGINGGLSYGRAALFSAEGYLVYTLASFGYKDLPKKMEDVDLEIFSASLDDWLLCGVTNCKRIQENLEKTGHNVEIQLVPGGHVMYAPYLPQVSVGYNKYHKFYLGYGGECSLETKSMMNVFAKTLEFFEKHLGSPAKLPDYKREIEIVLPSRGSKL
ncbi:unnamed protein product [Caenorhabditis brenneri]